MKQAFNADNFIKIYYDENRKGNYLDNKFPEFSHVKSISQHIMSIDVNFKKKKYSSLEKNKKANRVKEKLKKRKFNCLKKILSVVESKIDTHNLEIKIETKTIKNKLTFIVDNQKIETFFLLKQAQKNIKYSYNINQSDRNEIVEQLKNTLDNAFPKYVIRTDISKFYESIPHDNLVKLINQNNHLNYQTKIIINHILDQYKVISKTDIGIPRGIGISAYLAEMYIKSFDNYVKKLDNITYYARYVDDIIVIFTPNNKHEDKNYFDQVKQKIEEIGLSLNNDKTDNISLVNPTNDDKFKFDFLGYSFEYKIEKKKVALSVDYSGTVFSDR